MDASIRKRKKEMGFTVVKTVGESHVVFSFYISVLLHSFYTGKGMGLGECIFCGHMVSIKMVM